MTLKVRGKRWDELSTAQQVGMVVSVVIQLLVGALKLGLLLAALADLRRRRAEDIVGSKRMWRFVLFLHWLGPVAYFVLGRKQPKTA